MSTKVILSEAPTADAFLWNVYWGKHKIAATDVPLSPEPNPLEGNPKLLADIAQGLVNDQSSFHVLISGRYGTGKTSIMKSLWQLVHDYSHYRQRHDVASQTNNESLDVNPGTNGQPATQGIYQLWLNMPLITASQHVSAQAAVISQIINRICFRSTKERLGYAREEDRIPYPLLRNHTDQTGAGRSAEAGNDLIACHGRRLEEELCQTLEDLLGLENGRSPFLSGRTRPHLEPPQENKLPGTKIQLPSPTVRTDQLGHLENLIDLRMGWGDEAEPSDGQVKSLGHRLVVYLDDVDRCRNKVPEQIVRLLLRFRSSSSVCFVISSDWDLMECGVQDWMTSEGISRDGRMYVTANSALEKYFANRIIIPSLADGPLDHALPSLELIQLGNIRKLLCSAKRWRETDRGVPIVELWPAEDQRQRILADYLVTWLLQNVEAYEVDDDPTLHMQNRPVPDQPPNPPETNSHPVGNNSPTLKALPEFPNESSQLHTQNKNKEETLKESSQQVNQAKHSEEGKSLIYNLTTFGACLRTLLAFEYASSADGETILRFRDPYRRVAGMLTPRQLKYFLNQLRSGAVAYGKHPAELLLVQLYHSIGEMINDEAELLARICQRAREIVERTNEQSTARQANQLTGHKSALSSADLNEFHAFLETLPPLSHHLSDLGLARVWPVHQDECRLLVYLLAARYSELTINEAGHALPSQDRQASGSQKPAESFSVWVLNRLGQQIPASADISTQVVDFHDLVRQMYSQGQREKTAEVIKDYVEQGYLEAQSTSFNADTAGRLSNLAVLINDVDGKEPQANRLFKEAHRLQPQNESIALYWTEFLLSVANVPARQPRLIPKPYANLMGLLEQAGGLIEKASRGRELDGDTSFYIAILNLMRDCGRDTKGGEEPNPEMIENSCTTLIANQMPHLLQAAETNNNTPYGRLDSLFDLLVGKRAVDLRAKGRLFGLIWGMAEGCKKPGWPVVRQLANNYCGQSNANSPQERLGLRLNLWLLGVQDVYRLELAGSIWSQTLQIWSRQGLAGLNANRRRSRTALGLLLAMEGSDPAGWQRRARSIWQPYRSDELDAIPSKEVLQAALALDDDHEAKALYDRFSADPAQIRYGELVKAVFADDLGSPISTLAQFIQEDGWTEEHRLQVQDKINGLVSQCCPGGSLGSQASGPPPDAEAHVTREGVPAESFSVWVLNRLGQQIPASADISTQVVDFHDLVRQMYSQGQREKTAEVIKDYVEQGYLEAQSTYFNTDTSGRLSNLAVLINDVDGDEPQANRLFKEAHRLQPQNESIALYWTEFLLSVANVPARQPRLIPKPYANLMGLLEQAGGLIEKASRGRELDGDTSFYIAILNLMRECGRDTKGGEEPNPEMIENSCATLIANQMPHLLQAAETNNNTPYGRLDSLFDLLVGKRAVDLRTKGRLFGLIWGVAEGCKKPGWPVVRQLANNYCGQSNANSPQERLGLRLNLWLLGVEDVYSLELAGSIWSQTLLIWSRQGLAGLNANRRRSRTALGLLLAMEGSDPAGWQRRARSIWQPYRSDELDAIPSKEVLQAALDLDDDHEAKALYDRFSADPAQIGDGELVKAVFADDLGSPISTLAQFIQEDGWTEEQRLQVQDKINGLVCQCCPERTAPSGSIQSPSSGEIA